VSELPRPFDLSRSVAALFRDGTSDLRAAAPGPPLRVDGYVIGTPVLTENPPHGGEMHPDGDELLWLVSGSLDVVLELDGAERTVELCAGQGLVVPRGEPCQLLHVTPGPGGAHRPPREL
jgi:mannose-6-phosphate isomerase-like protein (cupin superfamily)